jgi:predicted phosphodiesterase
MLIDWVSDTHAGHWPHAQIDWAAVRNPGSDILIMGGDLANDHISALVEAHRAAEVYPIVLWTDGNHEHYETDHDGIDTDAAHAFMRDHIQDPRVIFMDGLTKFIQGGVMFIGCNGWYDFNIVPEYSRETQHDAWKRGSNDSKLIRFSQYPDKLAARDAGNLCTLVLDALDNPEIEHIIVFTHTSPLLKGLRRSMDPDWDRLNGAYGNSMMQKVMDVDINRKIRIWLYGHTHFNNDFDHEGIRIVSAPRGYPGDARMMGAVWERPFQFDPTMNITKSAFGEIE